MNGLEGGVLAFLLHPIRDDDDNDAGGGGEAWERKRWRWTQRHDDWNSLPALHMHISFFFGFICVKQIGWLFCCFQVCFFPSRVGWTWCPPTFFSLYRLLRELNVLMVPPFFFVILHKWFTLSCWWTFQVGYVFFFFFLDYNFFSFLFIYILFLLLSVVVVVPFFLRWSKPLY